jgi:ubiquinone/menaquinone biosynthesis C-methylase UbiE
MAADTKILKKSKFDYAAVSGDYQYKAISSGGKFRRFWHLYKTSFIGRVCPLDKEWTILDMGCGSGNILIETSKKVNKAYGADISRSALEFISKRISSEKIHNVELILSDGNSLPLKDSMFDLVISTDVIEHFEKPGKIIRECYRLLRPGGLLFLTTPNYSSFWPVMETLSDMLSLTPKMAGEQHLSKFNRKSLSRFLQHEHFKTVKEGSIYFVSPFMAFLSEDMANKMANTESERRYMPGMLLYNLSRKVE